MINERVKKFLLQRILLKLLCTRRRHPLPSQLRKIAIWQFGGIGDMIIGAAVVRDVIKRYPDASIDVYCSNPNASTFIKGLGRQVQGINDYDAYAIDSRSILNRKTREYYRAVLHRHQENKYDLLVNLHIPKLIDWWFFEIFLMCRSGAGFLAGFVPQHTCNGVLDRQMECDVVGPRHYLELYKELLSPLGMAVGERGYFPVSKRKNAHRLAVLHPGASVLFKRWPVANFIALARRLSDSGWRIAVVGDDKEKKLGEAMAQALPDVENHVGILGIQDMANLLAGADLFVGNDSAPFHLAVAVNVNAIGIFGSGPAMYSDYPAVNVKTVRMKLFCAPCFSNVCAHNMECMTELPLQRVWDAIEALIAHSRKQEQEHDA